MPADLCGPASQETLDVHTAPDRKTTTADVRNFEAAKTKKKDFVRLNVGQYGEAQRLRKIVLVDPV